MLASILLDDAPMRPTVTRMSTATLTPQQRQRIARFVRWRSADNAAAVAFMRRLPAYPEIVTATDSRGLAAVQLIDQRRAVPRDLVYLGPAVSRDGAYAEAFVALFDVLMAERPFWLSAEVANPRVLRDFGTLLPASSYPAAPALADDARRACRMFVQHIDHIRDFDPATLTTLASPGEGVTRYRLLYAGWDGTAASRDAVRDELRRGLGQLRRNKLRRRGGS